MNDIKCPKLSLMEWIGSQHIENLFPLHFLLYHAWRVCIDITNYDYRRKFSTIQSKYKNLLISAHLK